LAGLSWHIDGSIQFVAPEKDASTTASLLAPTLADPILPICLVYLTVNPIQALVLGKRNVRTQVLEVGRGKLAPTT